MTAKKVLLYYCFLFALFITVSGVMVSKSTEQLITQLIFLPVTAFLGYNAVRELTSKRTAEKKPDQNIKPFYLGKAFILVMIFFCFLVFISIKQVEQNNSKKPTLTQPSKIEISPSPQSSTLPTVKIREEKKEQKIYVVINPDDSRSLVNIRISPLANAKIAKKAKFNEKYVLLSEEGKWYKIILEDASIGYISKELATLSGGLAK
jgi:hypothetical protein